MPKYYTAIAQWGLVSGIRQDESDLIAIHPAPPRFNPQARKGQLLVVVEAAGDVARGREACGLVKRTIHETYYANPTGSITSSLRQTMQAANAAIYQYNFEAPAHKRATIGVSCAVLHGSDLYVVQVPPAQAFVIHAGKLRALPNPMGWIGGVQGGAQWGTSGALGTSLGSEPEFFRSVVQPGDSLVLCSSNVARLLSKQQAEDLLCKAEAATVAEGLYTLCRRASLPEAHTAVIEILPILSAEAQQAPLSVAGVSERGKLAASAVGDWLGSMAAEAQLAVQPKPRPASTASEPTSTPPAEPTPPPATNGRALLDLIPIGEPDVLPMSAFLGEGEYGGIVRPPAPKRDRRIDLGDNTGTPLDFTALPQRPPQEPLSLFERATLPMRQLILALLSGLANRGRRTRRPLKPVAQPVPNMRGLSYRRNRPPFPWIKILLLASVFMGLVLVGLQANQRRDEGRVRIAIQAVETALSAAQTAPDETTAQQALAQADRTLRQLDPLIAEGLITTTKTTWPAYQQLLQNYDRAMATINRIGFLENLTTFATLPNPEARISRVVLTVDPATGSLASPAYLLDETTTTVYAQSAGNIAPILQPGMDVSGNLVREVQDLLWRDDNPMALERNPDPINPFLIAYLRGGDGWFATKLPASEWLPPKIVPPVATYGGNLYVWNAEAQQHYGVRAQLLKYGVGRYADLPDEWIQGNNPAADQQILSAVIDGTVYLLHSDGSISVFEANGFKTTLPPPALAVPLVSVQRFTVTPDQVDGAGNITRQGYIYLLDTQNERVIQLDKRDGKLVQQMQMRVRGPLNRLRDLQVDEANRVIYLANGNEVLRASLPAVAASTVTPTATP